MDEFMLSLATNPYDPFEEYELWLNFDHHEGFDTAGFLVRVMDASDALSMLDESVATEQAIDSIMRNPSFEGLYKKVKRRAG